MENRRKNIWNDAARAGIILGMVSVVCLAISMLLEKLQIPMLTALVGVVLWLGKFIGCILLMRFFMNRFCSSHENVSNSDTFSFGCAVAFLSALVYSVCYFAYVQFLAPGYFEELMRESMSLYSKMLDSNTREAMENMIPRMPSIMFVTNLIYCSLYGIILSSILSRNIPSRNPFADGADTKDSL